MLNTRLNRLMCFSAIAIGFSATFSPAQSRDIPVDTQPAPAEPADGVVVEIQPRFTCETNGAYPTVMYRPISQPDRVYAWATPIELGGGWTPERRCMEISRRLEFYRPDGLLQLQTGRENGYNTVCATTQADSRCRIVFTVPPGENPEFIRDRVFENLAIADRGETTQPVSTFVEGNTTQTWLELLGQLSDLDLSGNNRTGDRHHSNIELRPFLDPADGGTGQYLQ